MQPALLNCQTHVYQRREPEKEVLYQAIADNLETLLERLRVEGHELPGYVVQEFYRYLDWTRSSGSGAGERSGPDGPAARPG